MSRFSVGAGGRFSLFDKIRVSVIIFLLSYPIRQRKGGADMNVLTSFLVAVAAGVACHFICKWLDGDDDDN